MRTTANERSMLYGNDQKCCDERFVRDNSKVGFRTIRGRPLPDLWMLPPQRGKRGRRYNRRASAMLSAYQPYFNPAFDEKAECRETKRQYFRAWHIGRILGETVT